jgi:hypothetical protein
MMTLAQKLTQGFRGLLYSRKGTLCLLILLLTASLLLIAGICSHWNSSILVAAFGCFGVIGSVVSAIFCNGNIQESIAAANNATTIAATPGTPAAIVSQVATSLMGNGPPPPSAG